MNSYRRQIMTKIIKRLISHRGHRGHRGFISAHGGFVDVPGYTFGIHKNSISESNKPLSLSKNKNSLPVFFSVSSVTSVAKSFLFFLFFFSVTSVAKIKVN
jgi:hypothetical protein